MKKVPPALPLIATVMFLLWHPVVNAECVGHQKVREFAAFGQKFTSVGHKLTISLGEPCAATFLYRNDTETWTYDFDLRQAKIVVEDGASAVMFKVICDYSQDCITYSHPQHGTQKIPEQRIFFPI